MAINDISLTAGMRNNLTALQSTSAALTQTQDRLSSGKKVNSALDNPTSFFSAQSHLQRASDLGDRKDGMSEGIQTVKAANAGITAITSLIQAAKGLASSALGTTDNDSRASYQEQYHTLLDQIDKLANDSGYKGTNLLKGDSLTVQFSQSTGTAKLDITGFNAATIGPDALDIVDPTTNNGELPTPASTNAANAAAASLDSAGGTLTLVKNSFDAAKVAKDALTAAAGFVAADGTNAGTDTANALTVHNASVAAHDAGVLINSTDTAAKDFLEAASVKLEAASLAITAAAGTTHSTGAQVLAASNAAATLDAYTVNTTTAANAAGSAANTATANAALATTAGDTLVAARLTTGATDLQSAQAALTTIGAVTLATYSAGTNGADAATAANDADTAAGQVVNDNGTLNSSGWDAGGAAGATNINASSLQLEEALATLRNQSSSLASSLSVITTRQDFTSSMINTLTTGADNLTLADMNQEGANMLMLQTRQSLSTTALSLSSQAAQSVLKLF